MSVLSGSFSELHLLPHGITIEMVHKIKHPRYKLLLNEVHSNYCKRVGPFYPTFVACPFLRFSSGTFFDFSSDFSRFRSLFLMISIALTPKKAYKIACSIEKTRA